MIRRLVLIGAALVVSAWPTFAQSALSLADAIARAQARNIDARAAEVAERQAVLRVTQARAGLLPSVDVTESWQRGNQPVFVFGSLLAQRQFEARNFAVDALNHPEAIDNLRTAVTVDQAIFDPLTRAHRQTATTARELASIERTVVGQDLAVRVTSAYGAVLVAEAGISATDAAIALATADVELARNRRDVGVATEADVLQIEMAVARALEQQIRYRADAAVARARLNQLLGEPLDAVFALDDAADPSPPDEAALPALETTALVERPDLKASALRERLAANAVNAAKAAFLPRLSAQGVFEMNGSTWTSRASSWTVGAVARINLFRGLGDQARLAEAREAQMSRALERQRAETEARVEVRVAVARLDAAHAAHAVASAAVLQARESHRIVRDRYEGGLADVTALLRAADGMEQALVRQSVARVETTVAAAMLKRAVGTP